MNEKLYQKMLKVREAENFTLKPCKYLVDEFEDDAGETHQFELRTYQKQMVWHTLVMKRFIIGDGTGLGKTVEAIANQCYLWEKEPDLKPVVVTRKSAIGQWAEEIDKFTTDEIGWTVVDGKPEDRIDIYREYFESDEKQFLIVNYARLRNDERYFREFSEGHNFVLYNDECFDYYTPVALADGSTELIGKIVNQQMDVEVLSYNFETGQVEPKKITNHFRNRRTGSDKDSLLKITFGHNRNGFGTSVKCTRSHEFFKPDGTKVEAQELETGDRVLQVTEKSLSNDQFQIVAGGLLGDSCISHPDRAQSGINFVHGQDQLEYLEWKKAAFDELHTSKTSTNPSGYNENRDVHMFRLNCNPHVDSFTKNSNAHQNGQKTITREWLDQLNEMGLAIWYGDDGSLDSYEKKDGTCTYQIKFHTQDFSLEEQQIIKDWLVEEWEIKAKIHKSKGYYHLYLGTEESQKFLDLMPGALPGVEYKFPDMELLELNNRTDNKPKYHCAEDRVVEVKEYDPQHKANKYVYDIEVEDNHNYFAGGTLVSNCTAFKNTSTKTHAMMRALVSRAERAYGLTATLIKNNLEEGFGIFKVMQPELFPTKKGFVRDFCVTRKQRIPGYGGKGYRYIDVIIGHKKEQIRKFRERIDPYYLGRAKHDVADELPVLTTKNIKAPITSSQSSLYEEALSGLLTVNKNTEEEEDRETTALTQLIYTQQIVNSPHLIGRDGKSGKEDLFFDLLNGDLDGQKVVVFTRFREMVHRLEELLEKKGYVEGIVRDGKSATVRDDDELAEHTGGFVRVTGKDEDEQRTAARQAFAKSDHTNLIFITMAGSDAINLQQASVMLFYDMPWSAGDYLQIVGRMIRIGSPHQRVYAMHMLAEGDGGDETIDHHVMETLNTKMGYIEEALGKRLITANEEDLQDLDEILRVDENPVNDLIERLRQDAQQMAS